MGKKAKEHRAKVAKRNRRVAEEKMKMQKVFNKMVKEQMDKFQQEEQLSIQMGEQPIEFSVIDPNEIEQKESND